uniref:NADH-ubiquinone oxidoreductase chain 3 n=1 Tax=Paranurophorus simplex TaxID=2583953 RepID=A0A6H0EXN1_9HEXA|nr:NADH dehydrogenase subunit 3 [Paranurophorus simplex]
MMLNSFLAMAFLSLILISMNSFMAKKQIKSREKPSAFECGFDSYSKARLPFSLRFFLIALIFLIFDVEITLILPIPMIMMFNNAPTLIILTEFFIIILIIGLVHEWNQGALKWK